MQYEDQCKCLRREWAFQNLSRAAFSFQTLNVPLPSQPSFHLGAAMLLLCGAAPAVWSYSMAELFQIVDAVADRPTVKGN